MLGLVLVLGLAVPSVFGGCAKGWLNHDGHCYSFSDHALNFFDAAVVCNLYGAKLAQIDSQQKQDWIATQLIDLEIEDAYIGGSNLNQVSVWEWLPGMKPFNYTNWRAGEPNYPETSRCVYLGRGDNCTWGNGACDKPFKYICERRAGSCKVSGRQ